MKRFGFIVGGVIWAVSLIWGLVFEPTIETLEYMASGIGLMVVCVGAQVLRIKTD